MAEIEQKKAVLVLANGMVFHGKAAGKTGTSTGEICFNTGMTGYQEVFTDPSYFGQVLLTTNAHIGNYGTKESDVESNQVQISGLVCKSFINEFSRQMADLDLQRYFENQNIVCIHGIDTREIVRQVREGGAMNCIISSDNFDIEDLKKRLALCPDMSGLELSSKVTTKEAYFIGDPNSEIKIAVMDFGTKKNILRNFVSRNCYCKVFPAQASFAEVQEFMPDAYFLSNGPGDPAAMPYAVEITKNMLATNRPIFGICLGHQILALANGIDTFKMHNGHRGINHPVKNMISGKCEITSQNHGFAVSPNQIKENPNIEVTHMNLNDDSIEGIRIKDKPAFSVQYHPEAAPGPHDSQYLFDEFINLIRQSKNN
jgi:carbamoyl-phosphate synthase small subunit